MLGFKENVLHLFSYRGHFRNQQIPGTVFAFAGEFTCQVELHPIRKISLNRESLGLIGSLVMISSDGVSVSETTHKGSWTSPLKPESSIKEG